MGWDAKGWGCDGMGCDGMGGERRGFLSIPRCSFLILSHFLFFSYNQFSIRSFILLTYNTFIPFYSFSLNTFLNLFSSHLSFLVIYFLNYFLSTVFFTTRSIYVFLPVSPYTLSAPHSG